jgi:hypothetical protein
VCLWFGAFGPPGHPDQEQKQQEESRHAINPIVSEARESYVGYRTEWDRASRSGCLPDVRDKRGRSFSEKTPRTSDKAIYLKSTQIIQINKSGSQMPPIAGVLV